MTEGAKVSGDAKNNIKDRFMFSSYLSEQQVKLLHNIMIYFSCQMNKIKTKNDNLC